MIFDLSYGKIVFLFFATLVVIIYWLLKKKIILQNIWVLIASYYFYFNVNGYLLLIIIIISVVNYYFGKWIKNKRFEPKLVLTISHIFNIGVLFYFKYFNWFINSVINFLNLFNLALEPAIIEILFPIGISFITFQNISYNVDIYRGKFDVEHNFIDFALYTAFFPKIISGPIERPKDFITQLKTDKNLSSEDIIKSFNIILIGLFKKSFVAAILSKYITLFYQDISLYNSYDTIIVIVLYSFLIYVDFSGYSEIAYGISLLFGIKININFEQPYFSQNIQTFWRKWHISLSNWIKDYIYIPLGGNRKGKRRTYINLLLTMTLCGIWHGAGLNFIIWGLLHGIYLSTYRYISKDSKKFMEFSGKLSNKIQNGNDVNNGSDDEPPDNIMINKKSIIILVGRFLSILLTFGLVSFAWIFFRELNLLKAFEIIVKAFSFKLTNFNDLFNSIFIVPLYITLPIILFIDLIQRKTKDHDIFNNFKFYITGIMYFIILTLLLIVETQEYAPYIYQGF